MASQVLWTVGHSNHEFDAFVALLAREEIRFVVDVRSYPYSQYAPHFNREELEGSLRSRGIRYLFFGEELGGRPSREEQYDAAGHALYGAMASEPDFQSAIERLVAGSRQHRLALMCSEADPKHCHRRLLVGKVLCERDVELRHILRDGRIWTECAVDLTDGQTPSLFNEDEQPWRSSQSVLHRRRLSTSSAA